jgi:glucose/arabinose dehydrogenase
VPGDPDATRVTGTERLGWNQQAANPAEVGRLQYAIYVDDARSVLMNAACGTAAGPDGFDCSAPLPPLAPGAHTLALTAFVVDGAVVHESPRSGSIRVVMAGATSLNSESASSMAVVTSDGIALNLERITEGLELPSDIAFSSDGTMFVSERRGTVRIVRDGRLLPDPAIDVSSEVTLPHGGLLAVALDPKFDETGFLYALYAADAPRDGLEFMLTRFRGVRDRFGERAVLLDRISASPEGASGALRIGQDGKIYVALDNADDSRSAGSFASYNGKVLRFNLDVTTPSDQALFTPIYSLDHPRPRALDWHPISGDLWVVDSMEPSGGRLSAVNGQNDEQRGGAGAPRTAYSLPKGTGASSAAFYRGGLMPAFRGDLFIAAEMSRELMRLQFDPNNPARVTAVERLLTNDIGPLRVVAEGPAGALYLATDTALYTLKP